MLPRDEALGKDVAHRTDAGVLRQRRHGAAVKHADEAVAVHHRSAGIAPAGAHLRVDRVVGDLPCRATCKARRGAELTDVVALVRWRAAVGNARLADESDLVRVDLDDRVVEDLVAGNDVACGAGARYLHGLADRGAAVPRREDDRPVSVIPSGCGGRTQSLAAIK